MYVFLRSMCIQCRFLSLPSPDIQVWICQMDDQLLEIPFEWRYIRNVMYLNCIDGIFSMNRGNADLIMSSMHFPMLL